VDRWSINHQSPVRRVSIFGQQPHADQGRIRIR
jgi:hypothetical protein